MANIPGIKKFADSQESANHKKFAGPGNSADTAMGNPKFVFEYTYRFLVLSFIFLLIYAIGEGVSWWDTLIIAGILVSVALGSTAVGAVIGFLFGIPHSGTPPVVTTTSPAAGTHAASPTATLGTGAGTGTVSAGATSTASTGSTQAAASGSAPTASSPGSGSSNMVPSTPSGSSVNTDTGRRDNNYIRSTNLEQIADWLTKIIVGVGLVEFRKIIDQFNNLCTTIGGSLKGHVMWSNAALVGGLILAFLMAGFLIAYLWTYLYLIEIQNRMSEGEIIQASVNQSLATVNEAMKDNDTRNKLAKDLAHTQLNLPAGAPDVPINDLINAFKNAYQNVCSSIFFDAVTVRKQCATSPESKQRVARTIPIFLALIAIDANFEYPENYLQLGYAYLDKENPDYAKALENIDKAIQNFDRGGGRFMDEKTAHYKRALTRIKLLQTAVPPGSGTDQDKNLIMADLAEAEKDPTVKESIDSNDTIKAWKEANKTG